MRRLFIVDCGGGWGYVRAWVWVAGVVFALTGLIGGIVAIARHITVTGCRNTAHAMHREYRSDWSAGCLVQLDDGSFFPLGKLRNVDVERAK